MARYGARTRLAPAEVLDKAVAFFGALGVGLEVAQRNECCAHLQGGGGHVLVLVSTDKRGDTEVTLETREWDRHIRRFMALL